MYSSGEFIRKISKLINRSAATISRELKRNYSHTGIYAGYYPNTAQKKYKERKKNCHKVAANIGQEIIDYIDKCLNKT